MTCLDSGALDLHIDTVKPVLTLGLLDWWWGEKKELPANIYVYHIINISDRIVIVFTTVH